MVDPKFPATYAAWIAELKSKVQRVQIKAAVSVNRELLAFYWELGGDILEQQVAVNWGEGFLSRLSKDLMRDFPEIKGFSKRNLELIRQWRRFWEPHFTIAKQPVSQLIDIPWGHHIALISKCGTIEEALFYAQSTVVLGWSRSILVHQIESGLHLREARAISNFVATLPATQSDLANQTLKDPYVFDFLSMSKDYHEKDLEKGLMEHIRKDGDQPTIGIIICKKRDKLVVEYALSDIHKPIGISEYQLTQSLPENLKSSLPSVEEIEAEFRGKDE